MTRRSRGSKDREPVLDDVAPRLHEHLDVRPALPTAPGAGPRLWRHIDAASHALRAPKRGPPIRPPSSAWSSSFDPGKLMPPPPVISAKPDIVVSGYAIEEVIGAGGMAVVHRARDLKTGRIVALKVMPAHYAHDERRKARFRREMRANSRLDHDNVVRITDFGANEDQLYLAAELVDGGSLHDIMGIAPRIPAAIAACLIDDLLNGLAHAHARGLIHRDLKPANLLLTRDGRLKINDFGIAVADGEPTLTAPGDIIGTPSYMSPEQAIGLPIGPASDLFSVGTILYEMLTGVNPFAHISQSLTLASVASGSVIPIFEIDPTIPAGLERLLDVLMATDVDERCQSAAHALELLRAARSEMSPLPDGTARKFISEPRLTVERLRVTQAYQEIDIAKALLAGGAAESARAAFLTYRATTLAPNDPEAFELQQMLREQFGFRFLAAPSPALRAMEAMMYELPEIDELVKQAAMVARQDGDLLRAAILFKRHLRVHPDDQDTRARLASIVGDDLATPAERAALKSSDGPVTRPERAHAAARGTSAPTRAERRRGGAKANPSVLPLAAALFPKTTVLAAAAAWIGARLYVRRRNTSDAHAKEKTPSATVASSRERPVDGGARRVRTSSSGDTSIALASALRFMARAHEPSPLATPVRMLLERAACSFALSDEREALADLSASIALMSQSDSRRNTLATVVSALEHGE
jgi:serine/threonine protein kinase